MMPLLKFVFGAGLVGGAVGLVCGIWLGLDWVEREYGMPAAIAAAVACMALAVGAMCAVWMPDELFWR